MVGDFNIVLSREEKRGGNPIHDPLREILEDLISYWELMDVKPIKGKYTWYNKRLLKDHIAARWDIFLIYNIFGGNTLKFPLRY